MRFLLFPLFFLFTTFSFSQEYVKNEFLVQLNEGQTHQNLIQSLQPFTVKGGVFLKQSVSKPFNIYLFGIQESSSLTEMDYISIIKRNNLANQAQVNHIIENRATVPNDIFYNQQWQYNNTGQSGGTPGADINIEEAWDETTGGLTNLGDTIVVCVIDGGFDYNHSDLAPNMWYNYEEIPSNGIDDDNNGYVDDFRGWNAYNNTDNIFPNNWHGTPVAGIIGANGNDSNGVAGVNWKVKIMGVSGGGNEAQALAAYTYPYIARKKYNESNGTSGAFVVATNASWGVNYGQAANAPLWCNFYDSLGAVGILNAGATANLDVNVDIDGDLPTQCNSDYLISVTNMNHFDNKVTSAGYGTTTIDLGAFGAGTYTTDPNNSYGGFGGTSGATPHVAGTIALLYSANCSSLSSLAKSNPSMAALKIKDYILNGVDNNSSLQGITTTGGRLNVGNSMNLLIEDCSSCISYIQPNIDSIVLGDVYLSWVDTSTAGLPTHIVFETLSNQQKDTILNVSSPYTLSNLPYCEDYKIQLVNECTDSTFANNQNLFASVEECCELTNFVGTKIDSNTVNLSWVSPSSATSLVIYYSSSTSGLDSVILGSSVNTYTFDNLSGCTDYSFKLQSHCPGYSNSETINVLTSGCGRCRDLNYCSLNILNNNQNYIRRIKTDGYTNSTGKENQGYGDYTHEETVSFTKGMTAEIDLYGRYSSNNYKAKLWWDFNGDGEFSNNERFSPTSIAGSRHTFEFTIPTNALAGPTRMRAIFKTSFQNDACVSATTNYGEVEDYCFMILNPVNVSETPSEENIKIFPNPTSDYLFVSGINQSPLRIFNSIGQKLQVELVATDSGHKVDITNFESGVYYVEIEITPGKKILRKIVKI
jgi:subtilisin family serine protease